MKRIVNYLKMSGVLLLLCSCSVNRQSGEKNEERPNVIFLSVDDLNDYPVSNLENVKTPNIDELRNSSLTFTNANCQAPLCIPSRASFFTGKYPHKTGVYVNGGDPWNKSEELQKVQTLPELFKKNNYYSYGAGKIYHANIGEDRMKRNFDNHPIYGGGFGPFPEKEHRVFSEKDEFPQFWGVQAFPNSIFPDVKNVDSAIDFLNAEHEKPFFMALGLWRPHTPFTAPERFFSMYDPDSINIPKGYTEDDLKDVPEFMKDRLDPFGRFEVTGKDHVDRWKHFIHGYYACTSFVDWNIGRLVSALDESKYAKNTILVIFSDNGFHLGVKDHWEKNTLWNTSSVVPLIVRLPDKNGKGRVVDTPVELTDLYPTLVEMCNLEGPSQELDGKSLVPFFEKEDFTWNKPALTSLGENMISIQDDEYRYIQYPDGSHELYNYKRDVYEWTNLADEKHYQDVVKRMQEFVPENFEKAIPGGRMN